MNYEENFWYATLELFGQPATTNDEVFKVISLAWGEDAAVDEVRPANPEEGEWDIPVPWKVQQDIFWRGEYVWEDHEGNRLVVTGA